jgi:hypothetical protein
LVIFPRRAVALPSRSSALSSRLNRFNRLKLLREDYSMADPSSRGICALAAANKLLSSKHKTDCQAKPNSLAVFLIRQVLLARCVSLAGRGRAKAVRAKARPACEQFGSLMPREFIIGFLVALVPCLVVMAILVWRSRR